MNHHQDFEGYLGMLNHRSIINEIQNMEEILYIQRKQDVTV